MIQFRNGYARNAPEMQVEFRGLRRYGRGRNAYYAYLSDLARLERLSGGGTKVAYGD